MMNMNLQNSRENSKRFDNHFLNLIEEGLTSCFSIVVSKNNEIIYDFTYGNSSPDKRIGTPVSKETLFNIGSVTKTITATLIVKLIEMGLITLNDPIKKFINEYRFEDVEVGHLLTHTAGFDGQICATFEGPAKKDEVRSFFEKIYNIDYRIKKPGEVWDYFTLGYCILMDIIERVTGETYKNNVQNHIFNPIGMINSYFDEDDLKDKKYIQPWDHNLAIFRPDLAPHPIIGDRGLFTTASDLVKFGNIFLNGGMADKTSIFKQPAIDFMLRDITEKFNNTPNFWMKKDKDIRGCFGDLNSPFTVGHTGVSGCMLFIDPYYKTCAAILTNSIKLHEDWKEYKKICNLIMSM